MVLEVGGALAPPLSARHGVARGELGRSLRRLEPVLPALLAPGRASGFAAVLRRRTVAAGIARSARRWRRRSPRDLIHIGIGGSALGAETLFRALAHPFHNQLSPAKRGGPRVHFLDNVDPETVAALLETVDLRHSVVHVVSKSGGTVETAAGFQLVRAALERRRLPWADHCVFTTGKGALRALAEDAGVETLPFPEDVGGRFSVLTPSGLLTPAIAGIDVAGVLGGARRRLSDWARAPLRENAPAVAAGVHHLLETERGKPIHVLMPYADALEPLSRWFVQLSGESLGKQRTRRGRSSAVGPTPVPARGTTDQHSQVQLFVEGPADKLVTFIDVARPRRALRLPGGAPADYLAGVALHDLLRAERRGTAVALAEAGRPTLTWELPQISPDSLGQVFLAFELQTAYQAHLHGIDAYDQPGVEAGKVAAYALIGRDGYSDRRAEIEANQPPSWKI